MGSFSYFFSQRIWEFDLAKTPPLKGFFIKLFRFGYIVYREFTQGQLNLRAMGLVYTTLLSLVPLLAVVFSILKAFGGHEVIRPLLLRVFQPLGPNGPEVVNRIMAFVENLNVGVLGFVGMMFLLYTVVSLLKKIEDALNFIWKVKRQRGMVRRISNYVSIIILGPILLFSSFAFSTTIKKSILLQRVLSQEIIGGVLVVLSSIMPFVSLILTFFLLYIFIPNVKVRPSSAFVGAATAAVLWHFTGKAFTEFVATANKYTIVYSTFAVLILFIIWLYIGWFVILAGAEIAYYHQYPQFLAIKEEQVLMSNHMKERVSLAILYLLGRKAIEGTLPLSINEIVQKLNLPFHLVQEVMEVLLRCRLVLETSAEVPSYVPAQDIGSIKMKDIYKKVRIAGQKLEGGSIAIGPVDEIMTKIDSAIEASLGSVTLKEIVRDEEA